MGFVLNSEETPGAGIARIVAEQAGKLREVCILGFDDPVAFVHKARVRCKKIRAALKLGRGLMSDQAYRAEAAFWRDTARPLSGVRDLSARIEAVEALRPVLEGELGEAAVTRLVTRFVKERDAFSARTRDVALTTFCDAVAGHEVALDDDIEDGETDDVLAALGEGYRAARAAMGEALAGDTPELFHEWRKKAKAHALQVRLARVMFPALEERLAQARDLGEHLGAVQDIEVVIQGLAPRATRMRRVLEARRSAMMTDAFASGRVLFGEKRKAWVSGVTKEPVRGAEDA